MYYYHHPHFSDGETEVLEMKYLIQDPELTNSGPGVSELSKSDPETTPLNYCAMTKYILETRVSSPVPTANLPSTLVNMVFCAARLLHPSFVSPQRDSSGFAFEPMKHRKSTCSNFSLLALHLPAHPAPRFARHSCVPWPFPHCHR